MTASQPGATVDVLGKRASRGVALRPAYGRPPRNAPPDDLPREMMAYVANRMMDLEVERHSPTPIVATYFTAAARTSDGVAP
jgi:hypothetical protein